MTSINGRAVFRGFTGGETFMTKKGYKGTKVDTAWTKLIFDSFKCDDEEVAEIALTSCIADVNSIVYGGEYGTPFSIGEYGFYAENQFRNQTMILEEAERANSKGAWFLSEAEWAGVDQKLHDIAHHGKPRFIRACRGDTFVHLAIRDGAFLVAKCFMDRGLDPMTTNEEDHDCFDIIKEKYADLSDELLSMQKEWNNAAEVLLLPSEEKALENKDKLLVESLNKMLTFIDAVIENLQRRLQNIEDDKRLKKVYTLKRQTLPPEKIWNMEQEPKVKHHLGESTELKGYINGKLNYHETFKKQHVSLASLIHYSHNKNTKKANIQNEVSDSESSIDEMMKKKIHRKAGSLSAKDMKALLGIENESHEINEEENDSITKDSEVSLVSLDDDNSTIDKIISSPPPRPIIDHGSSVKAILTIETEHETVHYI
jgi:hypothetical protein